ncbi:hypothetical protein NGTWS0302_13920 [Mycolicibacterium cyprinidarum]|uniref:DUF732 domain-containing protein n=1 Tax=Mycolicibacterium cyprinidarum TaxID=2860311 RepID=A0ABQ4VBP7_9MYCO|nr:hypothetical protein NGTWS1702_19280 [Mycolicibacterium sp. NGTWSNA01]GJF17336.1 hypothetical protein NGTWS0302_13920 [Mycolicibacterium sp. NGTWS0302]GJF17709.1 hypothetical protein NGTWS1803_35790 [Mycolicibacterium sp. NGTWS1803]
MRFMYLATASRFASAALVAVTMAATMTAAPAQADSGVDVFLGALNHYRLGDIDPATAVRVGESVCPMLAEPGQNVADVAAKVADEIGRPLGPATMFTGLAIQIFCPRAVAALTDGVPFSFFN